MTTSNVILNSPPEHLYVWTWLPGSTEPVVAGRVGLVNGVHQFVYGRSYLSRSDAVSLYGPELPLRPGAILPPADVDIAGCLWDASPDSWGQRIIDIRLAGGRHAADFPPATKLTYLIESGSDRIGALDFQTSASTYVPRTEDATLDELHGAAQAVERGDLSSVLSDAFIDSTAVGGARPKVLVRDEKSSWIAKLSLSTDPYPVVKAEAAAMKLARAVGIDVPRTHVLQSLGRDVLMVERFDRTTGGGRRMMVSALTMQGFGDFIGARYSSYLDVLDVLRKHGRSGQEPGRALFERIVFNIAVGNIDDHARNHAAFWDGAELELTPAYDICPQLRSGREARQAMDITADSRRQSQFALCLEAASSYGLDAHEARDVIERHVDVIRTQWTDIADEVGLTRDERAYLWGRQVLNPYAFEGYDVGV